jgi:hypothetical protein
MDRAQDGNARPTSSPSPSSHVRPGFTRSKPASSRKRLPPCPIRFEHSATFCSVWVVWAVNAAPNGRAGRVLSVERGGPCQLSGASVPLTVDGLHDLLQSPDRPLQVSGAALRPRGALAAAAAPRHALGQVEQQ